MEPDPEVSFLEPKHFIKDRSSLSDYECTICYELPARPVRCSNCRKSFCMSCVSDQKKVKDVCPFRCSDSFSIEIIVQVAVQFKCPYSKNCVDAIKSIREFYDHDLICQQISSEDKKFKNYMRQYLCLKGKHVLQFFIGTYDEMCNSLQCSHCKKKKLCRSICRSCNERFCIQCRPVPASKKQCPVGHQMIKSQLSNINYICDICGLPSILAGIYTYDDHSCNFGVCELCYKELPPERPPINCIENNPQYCSKKVDAEERSQHLLQIHKNTQQLVKCQICQQERKCKRKCAKCSNYYCFRCKTFLIESNDTCLLEHQMKQVHLAEKRSCDRCLEEMGSGYEDKQCEVFLCSQCFKYGKVMKSDSQRFIKPFFCDKGHLLMFHTSQQNFQYMCAKCSQFKLIKFFCVYCSNHKLFCCKCYPLPSSNQCYLGHSLKPIASQNLCHMCSSKIQSTEEGAKICNKCNLCLCKKCHEEMEKTGAEPA